MPNLYVNTASGVLPSNISNPVYAGQVMLSIGTNQWVPYTIGQANSHQGYEIGICISTIVLPGNEIIVQTCGRVPYDLFNVGPGNEGTVSVSSTGYASRSLVGQIIGTCDPTGALTVWPSRVATTYGILEGYAMQGTPADMQVPTYSASLGYITWQNSGGGSGGGGAPGGTPVSITIDPINGNDGTVAGPFKTVKRANAYLSYGTVRSPITVTVLSSPLVTNPSDDPFAPQGMVFLDNGTMTVTGPVTVLHTGTITGHTTMAASSNTRQSITDSALSAGFTAYQGMHVTDLTRNVSFWIVKAYGSGNKSAYCTCPCTIATAPNYPTQSLIVANGDAYQIEQFVSLEVGTPFLINQTEGASYQQACVFQNLNITGSTSIQDNGTGYFAIRSSFQNTLYFASVGYFASLLDCMMLGQSPSGGTNTAFVTNNQDSTLLILFGGVSTYGFETGSVILGGDVYITGYGLNFPSASNSYIAGTSGVTFIGSSSSGAQFQDCTSPTAAIQVNAGCTFNGSGVLLWGNGNNAGMAIGPGATPIVDGTITPLVTGGGSPGGDFLFIDSNGLLQTFGLAFDNSKFFYFQPTTSTTTWANLLSTHFYNGCFYPLTEAAVLAVNGAFPSPTHSPGIPPASIQPGTADQIFVTSHTGSPLMAEWITLTGDIGYSNTVSTVNKLQGITLTASSPSLNNVLQYNGTAWVPAAISGSGVSWNNDLAGSIDTNQYIAALSGKAGTTANIPLRSGAYISGSVNTVWMRVGSSYEVISIDSGGNEYFGPATTTSSSQGISSTLQAQSSTAGSGFGGPVIAIAGSCTAGGGIGGAAQLISGAGGSSGGSPGSVFLGIGSAMIGVSLSTPGTMQWTAGLTPVINQLTSSGAGTQFTIQAQNGASGNNAGGKLALIGGTATGTATSGAVILTSGAVSSGSDGGFTLQFAGASSSDEITFSGASASGARGLMTWSPAIKATLLQSSPTTDASVGNFNITAQSAFSGASSNITGGSLQLSAGGGAGANSQPGYIITTLSAPSGTGTETGLLVRRNGSAFAQLGPLADTGTGGTGATNAALYLGPSISPSTSNYTLKADNSGNLTVRGAANTTVTAGSGDTLTLSVGSENIQITNSGNGLISATSGSAGGFQYVAGTTPIIASNASNVELLNDTFSWNSTVGTNTGQLSNTSTTTYLAKTTSGTAAPILTVIPSTNTGFLLKCRSMARVTSAGTSGLTVGTVLTSEWWCSGGNNGTDILNASGSTGVDSGFIWASPPTSSGSPTAQVIFGVMTTSLSVQVQWTGSGNPTLEWEVVIDQSNV